MAYSDWTLETVKKAFDLEEVNAVGIFANVELVEPSAHLATALGTECSISSCYGHREGKIRTDCLPNSR